MRRRRRVLTRKKTTIIIDTKIRVHTSVSESAEVKPTFYRRPLDSSAHACTGVDLESLSTTMPPSSYQDLCAFPGLKDTVA